MKENKPKRKILVAMSGGVDSSVSAALLVKSRQYAKLRRNFDIEGVFMKFWEGEDKEVEGAWNRCCSPAAAKRASWVAKSLGIPFTIVDFSKEFKEKIITYFLDGFRKGLTPNPCIICNEEIKFGLLLEKVSEMGADFIATGHYTKTSLDFNNPNSKKPIKLFMGADSNKDQSYFLWKLNQEKLRHVLFPVSGYEKPQVRKMAKKFRLPVYNTEESQELCFITGETDEYLAEQLGEKKGNIVDQQGAVVGEHNNAAIFTIGQRKGLGLNNGPFYVLEKDAEKNVVVVTKNEKDLYKKELEARDVQWLSGKAPKFPLKAKAKIRYRHKEVSVMVTQLANENCKVVFTLPQKAITPGQSVVFYKGKELLGGGIIV